MHFTKHALDNIGNDSDLHRRVFLAATQPDVIYPSRRHSGGSRHIGQGLAVVVEKDTVITFYTHKDETPLRADQTDADALAHAAAREAEVKAVKAAAASARAVREQKRNARRDRDRALTAAQKGKKA